MRMRGDDAKARALQLAEGKWQVTALKVGQFEDCSHRAPHRPAQIRRSTRLAQNQTMGAEGHGVADNYAEVLSIAQAFERHEQLRTRLGWDEGPPEPRLRDQ